MNEATRGSSSTTRMRIAKEPPPSLVGGSAAHAAAAHGCAAATTHVAGGRGRGGRGGGCGGRRRSHHPAASRAYGCHSCRLGFHAHPGGAGAHAAVTGSSHGGCPRWWILERGGWQSHARTPISRGAGIGHAGAHAQGLAHHHPFGGGPGHLSHGARS